jgi:SAM-dependent methyltransferase
MRSRTSPSRALPQAATSRQGDSYEMLAPFYDALEGDRTRQVEYLRSLIDKHRPAARSVLELACGTGAILRLLQPRYQVAGVDRSELMLHVASKLTPQARLFQADMTCVNLAETFDVVLCVYDSINHMRHFEEWEAVFDRAGEHLSEGGIFVLDINTVRRLDDLIAGPALTRWFGDDNLFLLDVSREPAGEIGADRASRWSVCIFERLEDRSYRLHTEELREVSFSAARVEASLKQRFARVWSYDPERDQPCSETRRQHFVCEK